MGLPAFSPRPLNLDNCRHGPAGVTAGRTLTRAVCGGPHLCDQIRIAGTESSRARYVRDIHLETPLAFGSLPGGFSGVELTRGLGVGMEVCVCSRIHAKDRGGRFNPPYLCLH